MYPDFKAKVSGFPTKNFESKLYQVLSPKTIAIFMKNYSYICLKFMKIIFRIKKYLELTFHFQTFKNIHHYKM